MALSYHKASTDGIGVKRWTFELFPYVLRVYDRPLTHVEPWHRFMFHLVRTDGTHCAASFCGTHTQAERLQAWICRDVLLGDMDHVSAILHRAHYMHGIRQFLAVRALERLHVKLPPKPTSRPRAAPLRVVTADNLFPAEWKRRETAGDARLAALRAKATKGA